LLCVNALVLGLYIFARLDRPVAESFGPAGAAVHDWLNRYTRATVPLSATARRFEDDVKALGGRADVLVSDPRFLGVFGRTELFHASFHGPTFDDKALARIAELYGNRIDSLDLWGTGVTDAGLKHLKRMTRLRHLHISDARRPVRRGVPAPAPPPPVTDAGLTHLAELTQLETLSLVGLPVTDAGLDALKDLPALTSLSLLRTRIQGTSLARLKSLPQLSSLFLGNSPITEDGLRTLAGATSLKDLGLNGVPLTKEALPHLRAIPHLELLGVRGCGLLEEEVLDLAESRPGLKVVHE
jgi:hypothetical protein